MNPLAEPRASSDSTAGIDLLDTHCHILPGVDDGPRTLSGSLDLARALVAQGVTRVVATPHLSRSHAPSRLDLDRSGSELEAALNEQGLPLQIVTAREVSGVLALTDRSVSLRREALFEVVVIEAEPQLTVDAFERLTARAAAEGLRVIWAHPERCPSVANAHGVMRRLVTDGNVLQIVADSLVRGAPIRVGRAAWALLDAGLVSLVASDAHGVTRPPRLRLAGEAVVRRYGPESWHRLTTRNPATLFGPAFRASAASSR
jgi:protein-tyrosine phosphatase